LSNFQDSSKGKQIIKEKKLYAQASFSNSNPTRKTLKIKEAFPNLQNKKLSAEKTNSSQS